MSWKKSVTLLGSTGSIGTNALDVLRRFPQHFSVHALVAQKNDVLMAEQVLAHNPQFAVLEDEHAAQRLRERIGRTVRTRVLHGQANIIKVCEDTSSTHVVGGMVGAVGLQPIFAAIQAGKEVSIANKEVLVMAGEFLMQQAAAYGGKLLPIDSEHNAVFQCLQGHDRHSVDKVLLTASGGPFRSLPLSAFEQITKEQALAHPNWSMGPKNTIDSATMMNKGLEIIEARWLFQLKPHQIEAVIHPSSIVHALVRFIDNTLLAQLSAPDMRLPIAHCLAYPHRLPLKVAPLSLVDNPSLSFETIDADRYPCFFLAKTAMKKGGGFPAALAAANEVIVDAYLEADFPFNHIARMLIYIVDKLTAVDLSDKPYLKTLSSMEDVFKADALGREMAWERLKDASLSKI